MAETSIAKAYVQIIPSAEGIKGKLSSILSSEAQSAGTSAGKSAGKSIGSGLVGGVKSAASAVGSAFVTVAKAGAAGLAAGTAGIAAFSKSALDAYADYEQLVGGVETLFGESAGAVMKYADQAFQSAGLSANDYMETVTSFSASLLQSLSGDTAEATEMANMAVTDMSDNANKMGTNMQDIQNAYQGFAKQNYTMLDNLKLGYGGTQAEMKRLIEDAEKLDSSFTATRDANGDLAMSFSEIVEAIHIVQTEMGITGTTSLEASTTIQGSVSSMKAAWENLLVGVADDSQSFEGLMENFVTSTATAASNILPTIETILTGTGELVSGIAPIIAEAIPVLVETVLPEMVSAGVELVTALAGAIISSGPALIQAAMDSLRMILSQGLGLSEETTDGIMGVLQSLLAGCQEIFGAIETAADTLGSAITSAMESAGIRWTDVWQGIGAAVSAAASIISGVITGIAEGIAWVVAEVQTEGTAMNTVWKNITGAVEAAWSVIETAIDTIGGCIGWLAEEFGNQGSAIGMAWESVQETAAMVGDGIGMVIDGIVAVFDFFVSDTETGCGLFSNAFQLAAEVVGAVVLGISEGIQSIGEVIGWLVEKATTDGNILNTLWVGVSTTFTTTFEIISEAFGAFAALFQGDFEGFTEHVSNACDSWLSGVETIWDNYLGWIAEDASAAWESIKTNASTNWETMKTNASATWAAMKSNASGTWEAMKANAASAWDTMKNNASTSWNTIKSNTSAIWSGIKAVISGDTSGISSDTLAKFEGIKTGMSSRLTSAKNTVSSIFTSIKDGISEKIQAAKDAVHNAIEAIKEKFNFSWSLPSLKLPHVSISGSFSLNPPSVPSFSVSWYKKAMGGAIVLDGATIFGAMGGSLLGGGEAGREVVSGESHLLELMGQTLRGELAANRGEEKLERLLALLAGMAGVTININGEDYQSRRELAEEIMNLMELQRSRMEARYGY